MHVKRQDGQRITYPTRRLRTTFKGRTGKPVFPLPFMVVGLRDEAQNRKCPVSRTLVTPHVPAHDRAFRGLGSSASTERILTLSFTCASPCCPLAGTQRINPESPSCLTSPLFDDLGSFVASSHHISPAYARRCSFLSRCLESLGWFTYT